MDNRSHAIGYAVGTTLAWVFATGYAFFGLHWGYSAAMVVCSIVYGIWDVGRAR